MSSQMFKQSRVGLRARQAETLQKLLDAGSAELADTGREALTVRTVAARAGVSPATAYTYLASKEHLFAELFLGYLEAEDPPTTPDADVVARVQALTRWIATRLAAAPELAAAATPALLSTDPDVDRLRVRVGVRILDLFRAALAAPRESDAAVVDALSLAFFGALLQAGMTAEPTYVEMGERLDGVVATILGGRP